MISRTSSGWRWAAAVNAGSRPWAIWSVTTGVNRWRDGWFYYPDDGVTYRLSAHLKSDDVIVRRIYLGVPLLGKTKTLVRVKHGITDGWC